jgi:hypothetical protein
MKLTTSFLLLGVLLSPLSAQSVAEHRMYFRLGGAYSQNDLKAYLGDRAFSPIYELGYNFNGPTESTGYGLYVSYITAHGDPMTKYPSKLIKDNTGTVIGREGGIEQVLYGWRLGGDLHYATPLEGLTVFAGLSLNWWDGSVTVAGYVPNHHENRENLAAAYYEIPKVSWPEGKVKYGIRMGAEYRITKNWGVSVDGSLANWMVRGDDAVGQETLTGYKHYKGINPVNPSWINFAVQYRWNPSK